MKGFLLIAILVFSASHAAASADVTKESATSIKVSVTKTSVEEVVYSYDFLVEQKARIEADIAKMQAELEKVVTLLAESKRLDVVSSAEYLPPQDDILKMEDVVRE